MNPWKKLQESVILSEELQYRGDTFVTLKDLTKLFVGSEKQPGFTGRAPDPNGGVETGNYPFNPEFLALGDMKASAAMWQDDVESALAVATTDSAKTVQTGNPQGGTMVKKNYGGSVSMQNAPGRPHHNDRLGSSMDRYDVLLVADFDYRMNSKGLMVPNVTLRKVAWSPSIGSQKEREERLMAFLSGRNGPGLSRRPQPHRPVRTKDDEEHQELMARKAAERDAAASKDAGDVEMKPTHKGLAGATNQAFRDKMAKHNAAYQPGAKRKSTDTRLGKGLFGDDEED